MFRCKIQSQMKKISLLVVLILLTGLAGCGGSDNNNMGAGRTENNLDTTVLSVAKQVRQECIKIKKKEDRQIKRILNMIDEAQQENKELRIMLMKKYAAAEIAAVMIVAGIVLFFVLSAALKRKKRKIENKQNEIENKIAKQLRQNEKILQEIERKGDEIDKKIEEVSLIETRTEARNWEAQQKIQQTKTENEKLKNDIKTLLNYITNKNNKIKYLINKAYQGNPEKIHKKIHKYKKEYQEIMRRINGE